MINDKSTRQSRQPVVVEYNNSGSTVIYGVQLLNRAAATPSVLQQVSPATLYQSAAWDIDGLSYSSYWRIFSSPVSGSTPNHNLLIDYSNDGSAFTNVISLLDGYVGIGKAVPTTALDVNGLITTNNSMSISRTSLTSSNTVGYYSVSSTAATAGTTERSACNIQFLSRAWNGSASIPNAMSIRCRAIPAATTSGAIVFENVTVNGVSNTNQVAVISSTGRLGVGISGQTPAYDLTLSGLVASKIGVERHTTANTEGNEFTILAGGATLGATDKKGGDFITYAGVSTGTANSTKKDYVYKNSPTTGTSDNSAILAEDKIVVERIDNNETEPALALSYFDLLPNKSGMAKVVVGNKTAYAYFWFDTNGVVELQMASTNVFTSLQTGTNHLLIKDNGTNVRIVNELGSNQVMTIIVNYNS